MSNPPHHFEILNLGIFQTPHERRAISDAPKPLERDFTEYDTPGRDIHEVVAWPGLLRHSPSFRSD